MPTRMPIVAEEIIAMISKVRESLYWLRTTTAALGLIHKSYSTLTSMMRTRSLTSAELRLCHQAWVAGKMVETEDHAAEEALASSKTPHSVTVISLTKTQKVQLSKPF